MTRTKHNVLNTFQIICTLIFKSNTDFKTLILLSLYIFYFYFYRENKNKKLRVQKNIFLYCELKPIMTNRKFKYVDQEKI